MGLLSARFNRQMTNSKRDNMHNTSLSGLLRGVQNRHDDCGISWKSHKMKEINDNNKSISHLKKIVEYLEKYVSETEKR